MDDEDIPCDVDSWIRLVELSGDGTLIQEEPEKKKEVPDLNSRTQSAQEMKEFILQNKAEHDEILRAVSGKSGIAEDSLQLTATLALTASIIGHASLNLCNKLNQQQKQNVFIKKAKTLSKIIDLVYGLIKQKPIVIGFYREMQQLLGYGNDQHSTENIRKVAESFQNIIKDQCNDISQVCDNSILAHQHYPRTPLYNRITD